MRQVVQPLSGGPVRVVDVPEPEAGPTEVLVRTVASVLSPGTERMVRSLGGGGLIAKARARPDLVRQALRKARTDGPRATFAAVRARLDADLPLGYSAAGTVVAVGEHVTGLSPGRLVATGGAGHANHAEVQAVPGLLAATAPGGVGAEQAAFATIGSIALHGLRLAEAQTGDYVCVIGLGLIGQLAVRIALASGCMVAGIDVDPWKVERAREAGAASFTESGDATTTAIMDWSHGRGVDAVLVTASTGSSDPLRRCPRLCRDRAAVAVVGAVGMDLERTPLYEKEITLRVARSYGPGRYDRSYEEWGVDYPAGFVRHTEGRNMATVLDLLAGGRLDVDGLITHRFPIEHAAEAYRVVEDTAAHSLAVVLTYPDAIAPDSTVAPARPERAGHDAPGDAAGNADTRKVAGKVAGNVAGVCRIGAIGAGSFAASTLLPAFARNPGARIVTIASRSGVSARRLAERYEGCEPAESAPRLIDRDDVDAVVVATRHDSHAALTAAALRAGKHVWCEKPLGLSDAELDGIEEALAQSRGAVLFCGFNRRFSAMIRRTVEHFAAAGAGPLTITYRVSAGALPTSHWYHDRTQGGRLIGEVCHFVDTCAALVGAAAERVHVAASGNGERLLADHIAATLAYPDGSVATITYAPDGHASTTKERIEVLGRGRSALVDDFRELWLDGRRERAAPSGKGHGEAVAAFCAAVRSGDTSAGHVALASSRTVLDAAASLLQ